MGKEELLKELSQTMQNLSVEEFAQSIDKPKWKVYRMVVTPLCLTIGARPAIASASSRDS